MRKAQLQSTILVATVAIGVVGVILVSRCTPQEPPTFESPVETQQVVTSPVDSMAAEMRSLKRLDRARMERVTAHWTIPIPQVKQGEVFTHTIGISWDDYVQGGGLPSDWSLTLELELRKGGGGVVGEKVVTPGCDASQAIGQGWCGNPAVVYWPTDGLAIGDYEIHARLTWTNAGTSDIVYGYVEGQGSHDGQFYYLLEKLQVLGQTYLPNVMKQAK